MPDILVLDIETSPHITYEWKLWGDHYTPAERLIRPAEILCVSYKWVGERGVHTLRGARMAEQLKRIMTKADAVVTYNGNRFDLKRIYALIVQSGLKPPAKPVSIDLFRVVARNFDFPYKTLDYVCRTLLGAKKQKHPGMPMWIGCMEGDEVMWRKMIRYCEQDVRITEKLYLYLRPWISSQFSMTPIDEEKCPYCGSAELVRQGTRRTKTRLYPRLLCKNCGGWSKGTHSIGSTTITEVNGA